MDKQIKTHELKDLKESIYGVISSCQHRLYENNLKEESYNRMLCDRLLNIVNPLLMHKYAEGFESGINKATASVSSPSLSDKEMEELAEKEYPLTFVNEFGVSFDSKTAKGKQEAFKKGLSLSKLIDE
jgi:hypothetical protein